MKLQTSLLDVVVLFAASAFIVHPSAQADTFGTPGNEFTIDFVNIGNAGNAADTTGYGAVPYVYRMSTYEIPQSAFDMATASGMSNVSSQGRTSGARAVVNVSWFTAAAFVNWLNTSQGHQAAYNLTFTTNWTMNLWSSAEAWQLGGENLYRHKDALYVLPSEDEWYKAAYHQNDGATGNYWDYATGSDTVPTAVSSGTVAGTAVYGFRGLPVAVTNAGGLGPYGTMAQNGNVSEWIETAFDGLNDSATEDRPLRGGSLVTASNFLASTRQIAAPSTDAIINYGFRVASVPEPSTYALLVLGAGAVYFWNRRKSSL